MEIRPRLFGENLNEWFRAMGQTWKPLLVFCAIVFVPLGIVTVPVLLIPGVYESYFDALVLPENESPDPGEVLEVLGPFLLVGIGWGIVLTVALLATYLAASRAMAMAANGDSPTGMDLLRFGMRRLGKAVMAALVLIVGFALVAGLVTLIGWGIISSLGVEFLPVFLTAVVVLTALVVLIWLTVGFSLYPQAIAMEDVSATDALRRSFELIRGRWWPTVGFEVVAGLLVSAVAQLLSIALLPLIVLGFLAPGFFAVAYGVTVVLQGPTSAVIALAYAVWYIDLRAREGELTTGDLV